MGSVEPIPSGSKTTRGIDSSSNFLLLHESTGPVNLPWPATRGQLRHDLQHEATLIDRPLAEYKEEGYAGEQGHELKSELHPALDAEIPRMRASDGSTGIRRRRNHAFGPR